MILLTSEDHIFSRYVQRGTVQYRQGRPKVRLRSQDFRLSTNCIKSPLVCSFSTPCLVACYGIPASIDVKHMLLHFLLQFVQKQKIFFCNIIQNLNLSSPLQREESQEERPPLGNLLYLHIYFVLFLFCSTEPTLVCVLCTQGSILNSE